MLVKTRLKINAIVWVITAGVIIAVFLIALYQVTNAVDEAKTAGEIINGAFERVVFRDDYLRTNSESAKVQWLAKHEQIGRLLKEASAEFNDAESKNIIEHMNEDHEATGKLIAAVIGNREGKYAPEFRGAVFSRELENRLLNQLDLRLYDKLMQARRLRESANSSLLSSLKLAGGGIFCLLVIVTATALTNSWTTGHTIADRIARLRKGALVIGGGDLEHRIDIAGNDEFAELSQAFNQMAVKLGRARLDLENEVAERLQVEAVLRESEDHYRTLFSSIDEGFCVIGMIFDEQGKAVDYRFLEVNPSFYKQTGLPDALGKRAREVTPNLEQNWFEIFGTIALTGVPARFERLAEPLHRWYDVYAFRFGQVEKRQVAIIFNDISKRKHTENEIERLNADLETRAAELEIANRELEAFTYTVAHDLRKPLTAVSGYCQVLKELCGDRLGEECMGYLEEACGGTWRMNQLIDTLLNFSRLLHAELCRDAVDLSAMAQALAAELVRAEPDRKVEFRIAEGVSVIGDANLLRVVMTNLLGNAWKYTGTRSEARIEFGVTALGEERAYFISDNGLGFDMADVEKLFVPFQRVAHQEVAGHGVGLATVERIVRRHGGRVWAEGEPGKGATFYFTLRP